ncbi:class I SAM-dependent methyltransferase [Alkalihalobacillus oceani]|uniref:class I SAM-dependent methyltransferase n=1 Tax=Halalkalibacter oceani TaxID=1653776 RepID=UPI00203EB331|nr:class I SAM-dependent methyltransferase [Halalkalibacter oceani]MCM3761344.1 class I SAM-dependent methyltransferase [Halalkalibacter oceani]
MIVTTVERNAKQVSEKAEQISRRLDSPFIGRGKSSVEDLTRRYRTDVLVVGKQRLTLYPQEGGEPFYYHPNSAMFRVKQLLRSGHDPLVEAAGLQPGMSMLDCTLGLAADSLVAKVAVGREGRVTGLEANPVLALIVAEGLREWQEGSSEMLAAMRAVDVVAADHFDYLRTLPAQSIDVVYFDPMFETHLPASSGISALKLFACHEELTEAVIEEALRVSRFRVVLKDHWQSSRFARFSFHVCKRQHAAFHYGYIEKRKSDTKQV